MVTSTTAGSPVTTEVLLAMAVAFTDAFLIFYESVTGEPSTIPWEEEPERTYEMGVLCVDIAIERLDEQGWDCETAQLTLQIADAQNPELLLLYRGMIEWLGSDLGKRTRLRNLMRDCEL